MTAFTLSCGLGVARAPEAAIAPPSSVAPEAFLPDDWSVAPGLSAGTLEIDILALPFDGGSEISAIECSVDGASFAVIDNGASGIYEITGLALGATVSVALRAVNVSGIGPVGAVKMVTTADVPDAFMDAQWSLNGSGSDIQVLITALPQSEGTPVTHVQYSIDGAEWIDFLTNPVAGIFDILGSFAEGQAVGVAIRARNGIGVGAASDVKSITPAPAFKITNTAEGNIEISGLDGIVTIIIAEPSIYAGYDAGHGPGVFVFDQASLSGDLISLVPPRITGDNTAAAGDTLEIIPGLSAYNGDNTAPLITYEWLRNGVAIAGATGTAYTMQAGDSDAGIAVRETLTGVTGTSTSVSNTFPAISAIDVATHLGEQNTIDTITDNPTIQIDVSEQAAGDLLVFVYGGSLVPTLPKVNDNDATTVETWSFGSERRGGLFSYVLQQADIDAVTVDVEVNIAFALGQHVLDFIVTKAGAVADIRTFNNVSSATVTPTQAENTIYQFVHGVSSRFSGDDVSGVVYAGGVNDPALIYNETSAAAGILQNAPMQANIIKFTIDGSGNYAGVAVVLE